MQLRLKKIENGVFATRQWTLHIGGQHQGLLYREEESKDVMFLDLNTREGPNKESLLYEWNTENKYQTEYRKMRQALILYLGLEEAKKQPINVADKRSGKSRSTLIYTKEMEQADYIEQLQKHSKALKGMVEQRNEEITCMTQMITDLRTERRQADERYKGELRNNELNRKEIAYYRSELKDLGWKASQGSVEQSIMTLEASKFTKKFKPINVKQIDFTKKLPMGVNFNAE